MKFEKGDKVQKALSEPFNDILVGEIVDVCLKNEHYLVRWVSPDKSESVLPYTFKEIDQSFICIIKERDRKLKELLG
jgi:hypothetical protein